MPAMLATREDIDATLHDQRPPCKPLDLPQCYARDLKVPRTHEGGHAVRARTPVEGFLPSGVLRIAGGGDVRADIHGSNQWTTASAQCGQISHALRKKNGIKLPHCVHVVVHWLLPCISAQTSPPPVCVLGTLRCLAQHEGRRVRVANESYSDNGSAWG